MIFLSKSYSGYKQLWFRLTLPLTPTQRARTRAESSVRPTRSLTSDGKQKLHSPSVGGGSPALWMGAPPRGLKPPGLWIFCLP